MIGKLKMKRNLLYSVILASIPSLSFATVGGPETIEILGADTPDQKIYFLRHYHDQSGRLPTLYYFKLNTHTPHMPVEVTSIYPKMDSTNFKSASRKTLREITKIKKRLIPVNELPIKHSQFKVLKQSTSTGNFWVNVPEEKVKKQLTRYEIQNLWKKTRYNSNIGVLTSYLQKPIKIIKIIQSPDVMKPSQIAIVQYLGIPTETGYFKEDAVLLSAVK